MRCWPLTSRPSNSALPFTTPDAGTLGLPNQSCFELLLTSNSRSRFTVGKAGRSGAATEPRARRALPNWPLTVEADAVDKRASMRDDKSTRSSAEWNFFFSRGVWNVVRGCSNLTWSHPAWVFAANRKHPNYELPKPLVSPQPKT